MAALACGGYFSIANTKVTRSKSVGVNGETALVRPGEWFEWQKAVLTCAPHLNMDTELDNVNQGLDF